MDTSDDFLATLLDGGGLDIPAVRAEPPKRTAAPADRGSEEARRNRNRRRAAASGDRLEAPRLGVPGLFGAGPVQ